MHRDATLDLIRHAAEVGNVLTRTRYGWTITGPVPARGQCPVWAATDDTLEEMLHVAIAHAEKVKGT